MGQRRRRPLGVQYLQTNRTGRLMRMPRKPRGGKTGRPAFEMNADRWKLLDVALTNQATELEAAAYLGCSVSTLKALVKRERGTNFRQYRKEKARAGRAMLRTRMWKAALAGNMTACIW